MLNNPVSVTKGDYYIFSYNGQDFGGFTGCTIVGQFVPISGQVVPTIRIVKATSNSISWSGGSMDGVYYRILF